ncbi:MAG: cytochrome c biogenesis protein CcsA [Calditrichia bacterium]
MLTGQLLIVLALASAIASAYFYLRGERLPASRKDKKKEKNPPENRFGMARNLYYFMTLMVSAASLYLFYLFITHQFQVSYVYRYSSSDLPFGLLLSAFWAGQEGSFLLWALFIALSGIFFMKTARQFEGYGMIFLNIVQAFFLVLLIKASPFATFAQTPPDGAGLNPLLQNFWMIIHPPILFLGYATATFPMIIALAALVRREYDQWIPQAFPWILITSVTLGAGIIIGAFWAYEVLGWGGYWGWDPVENSSLIPWLTTLALLHGVLVERKNNQLKRTNFLLAILTFILVIYATFLTRSGVLSDFSVHSFQDLGINSYLIIFLVAASAFSLVLFLKRSQEIGSVPLKMSLINRESILLYSMVVLLGSAIFTFFGTSSPIITGFLGKSSQVHISYYNKVNLPFGIIMGLLLGIAPFIKWNKAGEDILKNLILPGLTSLASMFIAYSFGLYDPLLILFTGMAAFTFASNFIMFIRQLKGGWQNTAAPLTHVGVGLLLVGIVISGQFEQREMINLTSNQPVTVLDHELTYEGMSPRANGKNIINIQVKDGNQIYQARPRLYLSEYNRSMMHEPHVIRGIWQDFYVSPLERRSVSNMPGSHTLILKKGEKKQIGDYEILFTDYRMGDHSEKGGFGVGANLEVSTADQKFNITPVLYFKGQKREYQPATLPLESPTRPTFILSRLNADQRSIELTVQNAHAGQNSNARPAEQLTVEVSKKPFMNILWLGTILLIAGTVISFSRSLTKRRI